MKKFKLLLIVFLLPITFIIYYLTSEEYGISAYIEKQKSLDKVYLENKQINKNIEYYKKKINLLTDDNPDIDLLNEKVVIPCNREDGNGNPICLGNCIFASEPNHPYWKSLMDTLFTIDRTKLDYNTDKSIDGNVLGTGPMFVFAMWKKYSKINDDVCVSKRNLFHPPTKINNQYIEWLKKDGCYGMHICTGLWRNSKL